MFTTREHHFIRNSRVLTIHNPGGIYIFKVNNKNTRTRCEICSKLTIKTPEPHHWRRSGIFLVHFNYISHLALVFLLLTLNMQMPTGIYLLLSTSSEIYPVMRRHK